MEIAGAGYLYTLALVSITYAGFAALFMLFRQDLAGHMAQYDAFLIRGVVQKGFIVTGCAMLPPLLAYCEVPEHTIWRISSVVAGLFQLLFLVTWIARRRGIKNIHTSKWLIGNLVVQLLTALLLFVGATGKFFPAGPGAYLVGVTLILFLSGVAYQEALVFLLRGEVKMKPGK